MFLRCGDYLKFLMGLGKFRQKDVTSYTFFFAVQTISSFGWHLEKFPQTCVPSYTFFFSLWRLTWVFDGTGKNFHRKVCPVICFFAVETISSFWWGLEKFPQKFVPSYTFFLWRLTWVFDGTWKNFHKKVCPVTRFFAVETILSFWGDLESFDKKMCPVTRFFSLWRITWVFEGTWKNFHQKVCPVICFFAVETILSFRWDLESFGKKMWPVTHFFSQCRLS